MKNTVAISCLVACFWLLTPANSRGQAQPDTSASPQACPELAAANSKLEAATKTLQDWPNMARYRDANTKVVPLEKKETRVVFMGDSITDAWVRPEYGGFFPGKPYIDRGISGQTTPQMLIRFGTRARQQNSRGAGFGPSGQQLRP